MQVDVDGLDFPRISSECLSAEATFISDKDIICVTNVYNVERTVSE